MSRAMRPGVVTVIVPLVVAGLVACGEEEIADLTYTTVKPAVVSGDAAAFDGFKGKKVRWTGTVTESTVRHGEEYAEEGHLYVDVDSAAGGDPFPDVTMEVSPDQARSLSAGQTVTFVAVLLEPARGEAHPMVRANLREIETN
ncbi:MAG: hypothetical protein H6905_03120 [Hyphomicrobiales bacterium]|nr:hypothetical protein [Hyphomicrobiales bacterium]